MPMKIGQVCWLIHGSWLQLNIYKAPLNMIECNIFKTYWKYHFNVEELQSL